MKIFLKKEVYFEVTIADGSNRTLISKAFEDVIDPAFEKLVRKIKFDKKEIEAVQGKSGIDVSVRVLPKSEFLSLLNSK